MDITQREAMYEAVVRRLNQMRPLHPLTDDVQREEVRLLGALATLYEKDPDLMARVTRVGSGVCPCPALEGEIPAP